MTNLFSLFFFFVFHTSGVSNQNNASQKLRKKFLSLLGSEMNLHPFYHCAWSKRTCCFIDSRWILKEILTGLASNRFSSNETWSDCENPFSLDFNDNRISEQALSFQQHSVFSTDCNLSKCCNDGNRSRSSYVSDLKADGEILSFLFSP